MYKYALILVFLFTLVSCATVQPFPSENIVISAPTAFGRIYVRILKGRLNKEHRGEWWVTEERFIELRLKGELGEELLPEEI
jgi:hypothetical protein